MAHQGNIFLREEAQYVRNLDILKTATGLAADYLNLMTGKPLEECLTFVRNQIAWDGSFPVESIVVKGLQRLPNQDRVKVSESLDTVLKHIQSSNAILSPNFVIYDSAETNKSCTSKYVEDKMTERGKVKRMALQAQQQQDHATFAYCNNSEYGIKILTNSLSGAQASPHNPLFNKTAHSSLTSTTRVIVSYSNASTEKFLKGNRHYHSKDIVIENILAITKLTDYEKLRSVINKYDIYIPTAEELLVLVKRSTKFYWTNTAQDTQIYTLLTKLTALQRAAFMYVGDFFHLTIYNDALVRNFLTKMITRPAYCEFADPDAILKTADEGIVTLTGILCADILAGSSVNDIKQSSLINYNIYVGTIHHVSEVIAEYSDLLIALFVTDNVPSTIYNFPDSIRRCVVGSDTDSTMFTTQSSVEWFFGRLAFGHEADKIANVLCYLNTQVIAHMLASCSRQMGAEDKYLYKLEMKNEYGFPIYIRANRAKHYATLLASREGNVYKIPKNDIKGVGLKDSKIPRNIMVRLEKEINNVMMDLLGEKTIDIYPLMQRVANLEHNINNSLNSGSMEYLSTVNISAQAAYKNPMSSKYMHYDLWLKVFQGKFGVIEQPPYRAIKISTTLHNSTAMTNWLQELDTRISRPLLVWMEENKKTKFEQLLLPLELFENGVPTDFVSIINKRKIIAELLGGFYILFEMLGMFFKGKNATILLFDDIPYRQEYGLPGDIIPKPTT